MDEKEIRALFCKWCPWDSADLCDERECGCLSVKGFVKELVGLCDKCIYKMIAGELGEL